MEEIRDNVRNGRKLEDWKKGRGQYFEDRKLKLESWQSLEMQGGFRFEELEKRNRKMQKEKRWEKIRKAKYKV